MKRADLIHLMGHDFAQDEVTENLPVDHPVRYAREREAREGDLADLIDALTARYERAEDNAAKDREQVEKRFKELESTFRELLKAAMERPLAVTVEAAPPTIIVQASDVKAEFSPTFKVPEIKMPQPEMIVVHAPEKKTKRKGTMKKNKDGTFEITVEDE